jgi:hypothetical protein
LLAQKLFKVDFNDFCSTPLSIKKATRPVATYYLQVQLDKNIFLKKIRCFVDSIAILAVAFFGRIILNILTICTIVFQKPAATTDLCRLYDLLVSGLLDGLFSYQKTICVYFGEPLHRKC